MDLSPIFLILVNFSIGMLIPYQQHRTNIFSLHKLSECLILGSGSTVIVGDENDNLIEDIQGKFGPTAIGVVGFKDTEDINHEKKRESKLYKLENYSEVAKPMPSDRFFINQLNCTTLRFALHAIENSVWWNLGGLFVIILTHFVNSCDQIHKYSEIVWEFDILKAIFLCHNAEKQLEYFIFDPFNNNAPNMWVKVSVYRQKNNYSLSLFKLNRETSDSMSLCSAFYFKKISNLNGYPIKLVGYTNPGRCPYDPNEKVFKIRGVEGEIAELLWTKLNASVNVTISSNDDSGIVHSNGSATGLTGDVLSGKYDYLIPMQFDEKVWKDQFYLYTQTKMCFVTMKRVVSVSRHFLNLITLNNLIIVSGILLILVIIIQYLGRKSLIESFLDVVRAMTGVATTHEPRSMLARISFYILIVLAMMITFFLQSEIYMISVDKEYKPFVNSEQELIDLGYKIYAKKQVGPFFRGTPVQNELHYTDTLYECTQIIEEIDQSACAHPCSLLRYEAVESSRTHITEFQGYNMEYCVLIYRDRFSLREIVNSKLRDLQETGIISYLFQKQHLKYYKKNNETEELQPISLTQASLGFVFLIWGSMISVMMFFMEHMHNYMRKYNT